MGQFVEKVQYRFKNSSFSFLTFAVKLFSGMVLGLTLSLIGQEIIGYQDFAFFFVIVLFTGVFLKIAKKWQLLGVVIFDVFCILIGTLLKMYIMIAPGA